MTEGGKKERVLVIELEPEMGIYLSNLLRTEGFETIVSDGGRGELSGYREARPHLIILDGMLPKAGSFQIYRFIKNDDLLRQVPVIMLSNIDKRTFSRQLKVQCGCSGQGASEPDAILEKPPEAERLLALVQMLTAQAK